MSQSPPPSRKCEQCDLEAVAGERYCKICRKIALEKMKSIGYLVPVPPRTVRRTIDQMENTYETKYGINR